MEKEIKVEWIREEIVKIQNRVYEALKTGQPVTFQPHELLIIFLATARGLRRD